MSQEINRMTADKTLVCHFRQALTKPRFPLGAGLRSVTKNSKKEAANRRTSRDTDPRVPPVNIGFAPS
jgi:hypothetical protein